MPNVSGIDHAIGYAALANGSIEVKDAYSTDAKIQENDLVVLRDDLHFFPEYKAVFLYRLKLDPRAIDALESFRSDRRGENDLAQRRRRADQELRLRRLALLSSRRRLTNHAPPRTLPGI